MTPALKAAVVLLVTLPVLAYVGGTLSAAPPDRGPRTPVILQSPATPTPSPAPSPSGGPREDDGKDEGKDDGLDDEEDDGQVRVVNPSPTRVGEDDGRTGDDEPEPDGDDGTDDDTTGGDD